METCPILFVCLGNICRSPLCEGIFRHLAERSGCSGEFPADSAGTGAWHAGNPPDPRSVHIAAINGIDISRQRARQVEPSDFERFALVFAMDRDNLRNLERIAPAVHRHKLHLFATFTQERDIDVPDPYYGGRDGFEQVYAMLFSGCTSLLEKLAIARRSCSGKTSSVT